MKACEGLRLQPPHPTREARRRVGFSGFTLIELMVVMMILTATTVAVGLALGSVEGKARVLVAGEDLASLLETLSVSTSITRKPVVVSFAPGSGEVSVTPVAANAAGGTWVHRLPGRVVVRQVNLGRKIYRGETVRLMIQPSGHIQDVTVFLGRERVMIPVVWSGQSTRCIVGALDENGR